jgi:hypothetical protein
MRIWSTRCGDPAETETTRRSDRNDSRERVGHGGLVTSSDATDVANVEATISLAPGDTIAGSVTTREGVQRTFFGWLELMDALEEVRTTAGSPATQAP